MADLLGLNETERIALRCGGQETGTERQILIHVILTRLGDTQERILPGDRPAPAAHRPDESTVCGEPRGAGHRHIVDLENAPGEIDHVEGIGEFAGPLPLTPDAPLITADRVEDRDPVVAPVPDEIAPLLVDEESLLIPGEEGTSAVVDQGFRVTRILLQRDEFLVCEQVVRKARPPGVLRHFHPVLDVFAEPVTVRRSVRTACRREKQNQAGYDPAGTECAPANRARDPGWPVMGSGHCCFFQQ